MTPRATGLLIGWMTELRFEMILTGWNHDPTRTNDIWRVWMWSPADRKKIRSVNVGLGALT
jgi:hypothetical protein